MVNLGHEARRISYFHIFCVLEAGTTLENQKWKVHPEICGLRFLVSRKKNNNNNNNFKEDICLVESCRFSCRLIQQKGIKRETTPIPIILKNN